MSYWVNSPPNVEPVVPVGLPVEVGLADVAVFLVQAEPGREAVAVGRAAALAEGPGRAVQRVGEVLVLAVQAVGVVPDLVEDVVVPPLLASNGVIRPWLTRTLLISSSVIGKLSKSNRKCIGS